MTNRPEPLTFNMDDVVDGADLILPPDLNPLGIFNVPVASTATGTSITAADIIATMRDLRKHAMNIKPREARYRTLWVSTELMLSLIPPQLRRHEDGTVDVYHMVGIPDDVEVLAVHFSDNRNAFGFRLWHASFDIVDPCQMIPEIVAEISVERLRVVPLDQRGREFL